MAEPTQGNPLPPNNQDGLAPINQADTATKAFDAFYKEMEDLKKLVEKSNQTMAKNKELQDKHNAALFKQVNAEKQYEKSLQSLTEGTKKWKDAEGKWLAGTEAIQEQYQQDLQDLTKDLEKVCEETQSLGKELAENTKAMSDEKDARMSAIFSLRDLRNSVKEFDVEIGVGLTKAYGDAVKLVTDANATIEKETTAVAETAGKALIDSLNRQTLTEAVDREVKAHEAAAEAAEVAKKAAEERAEADKEAAKTAREKAIAETAYREKMEAKSFGENVIAGGGMVGIGDIKEQMDLMVKDIDEAFKLAKPDADEGEIAANRDKVLLTQKENMITNIKIKQEQALKKAQEERIKKIMEEQKVSRSAATTIADSKENRELDAKQISKNEEILETLKKLDQHQLIQISKMDDAQIKDAEKEAEGKSFVPPWAQKMIDGIAVLKDSFSGIFKGNEGILKKIALILMIVIGTVIGYIWTKVQVLVSIFGGVFGLLKGLPLGIGKAISGMLGSLGGLGGGITKMFGGIASHIGQFGKGLAAIFPFFGQLGKAFSFGFRILGKVFFYVGLVVDAIFGAYKGFQKLGDIRGMIIGAVAQIISGLTFGLLDFESIFDFLNKYFGETIKGFIDNFVSLVMSFYNLAIKPFVDAIMNIVKIFQGGEGIFTKIFKSIYEMVFAGLKYMIGMLIFQFIKLPIYLLKAWLTLMKFIYYDIPMMLWDAVKWLWDWFTSGKWLDDLLSFGEWLNNKFMDFFNWILNSLADALGELPFIGGAIKEALGGGTKEDALTKAVETSAKIVDEATNAQEMMADQSGEVQYSEQSAAVIPTAGGEVQFAPTSAPSYTATTVNTATSTTNAAKMNAMAPPASVPVNAPTTNNVVQGGGGGESNMLMPTNNRNTEPTFRALLFKECPAL